MIEDNCECPEGYDEQYHCKKCDVCCFSNPMIVEKNATYEDRGNCIQCALNEGMTVNELIGMFQ